MLKMTNRAVGVILNGTQCSEVSNYANNKRFFTSFEMTNRAVVREVTYITVRRVQVLHYIRQKALQVLAAGLLGNINVFISQLRAL